jgi:hypothetical protein
MKYHVENVISVVYVYDVVTGPELLEVNNTIFGNKLVFEVAALI